MVDSLRSGFNSTVLAYGDSGSGKTHTMIGPPDSIGEAEVRRGGVWWRCGALSEWHGDGRQATRGFSGCASPLSTHSDC